MTSGDAAALESAIRRHERELLSFAWRMTRRDDAARDCLQDALLKAHVAVSQGAVPEQPRAWLYRLTYNAIVDWMRRNDVEERARARAAEHARSSARSSDDLDVLIGGLPDEYREILYLRYAQDLTYEEMEDVLGRPSGTLRVYAARALAMVHDRLKGGRRDV